MINYKPAEKDIANLWPLTRAVTEEALSRLTRDRERERNFLSRDLIKRMSNKNTPPLVFIFNDAELFGQWSRDPVADREWMEEFFRIVIESEDASFTT